VKAPEAVLVRPLVVLPPVEFVLRCLVFGSSTSSVGHFYVQNRGKVLRSRIRLCIEFRRSLA
jgi:hypothetical protein